MTTKIIIMLLTFFLTMSPLTAKAQIYIYDAEDGKTENGYPYVYTPKEWHLTALGNGTGLNGMGPMKWNFASPQSDWSFPIASYAQLAIQNWLIPGGQPIMPNWISTLQRPDSEVNGIALRIHSTQGPCSGIACVEDDSRWVDYGNHAAYTKTINMYIPKTIWNSQQAVSQKRILAHEFGHIWGLADRYPSSGGCITTEDSLMEIFGCTAGFTPKSVDLERLQDFHPASWSTMDHGTAYLSGDKKRLM